MSKQNDVNQLKQAVRQQLEDLDDRSLLSTAWEFVRDLVGVFTLVGRGGKLVVAAEVEIAKGHYIRKRLESGDDTTKPAKRKWFD